MQLVKYLKELLFRHDLVIIPDFGALIIKPVSAQIDPEHNIITPPGKTLSFNAKINANDGLLAHHIASQDKIPYESALNFVQFEVEKLKEALQKEDVQWEGIGSFSMREDNIVFTPDPLANFDTQAFGLSQVSAAELNRNEDDEFKMELADILDDIIEDNSEETLSLMDIKEQSKANYGFIKYVAGLVLLLGLGYLIYNKYQNNSTKDTSVIQQAAFEIPGELRTIEVPVENTVVENESQDNQTGKTDNSVETSSGEATQTESSTSPEDSTGEIANHTSDTPKTNQETQKVTGASQDLTVEKDKVSNNAVSPTLENRGKYHIIAGAFKFPENAEKKIRQLQKAGYQAYVVGVNKWNLTQVAFSGYNTKREAQIALRGIRNTPEGKDAWILVK